MAHMYRTYLQNCTALPRQCRTKSLKGPGERKEGGVWEISTTVVEYILSKA